MDWNNIIIDGLQMLVYVIIAIAIPRVVSFLRGISASMVVQDLISSAERIVTESVQMVNQTFVDVLKDKGQFDKQAMAAAFQKCRENILALLSDEAKVLISTQFGNLELWIETKIEANVRNEKLI